MTTALRRECGEVSTKAKPTCCATKPSSALTRKPLGGFRSCWKALAWICLTDVGDWIVDCASSDELLERLNRAPTKEVFQDVIPDEGSVAPMD